MRKKGVIKKALRRSKDGVHSLVGELLVMVVTIIIFSGIFTYVLSLPPPEDTTYSDFEYETPKVIQNGASYFIFANITNSGGQTLYDHSTGIYIFLNDELYNNREYSIHESYNALGSEWKVGEVWSYPINVGDKNQSENASVRAMVIDKSTNTIVYNQYITGIPNSSPIIMDKFTDPRVGIISDLARFYVNITDANGDIVDAYVDMTNISDRMGGKDRITLTYQSGLLYRSEGVTVTPDWARIGSNEVTIVVTDAAGHIVTSRMVLQAKLPDSSNETGYEPPNIIYSKNDGFNIFKKTEWERDNFLATRGEKFNYTFVLDSDDAAVIVVSKNLLNTEARNYIEVYDITTKEIVYKSEMAFTRYQFTQGFYCYQAFINIDSPQFQTDERYIVNAVLKDNSMPSHSVIVSREISTRNGGDYPWMQTFVNRTDANASISFWNNNIVEVKINGNFPANTDWYGPAGDIIIRDFTGGTQMHWAPAVPMGSPSYYWNNGPVSNVVKIDSNTYGFAINLTAVKSGDAWVAGRNQAYTLEYDMFTLKDTSGNYFQYQLSSIIYISSPTFSGRMPLDSWREFLLRMVVGDNITKAMLTGSNPARCYTT